MKKEQGVATMRKVPSRHTVRCEIGGTIFYLKKFLRPEDGISPFCQAARELLNMLLLKQLGILTPEPVLFVSLGEEGFSAIVTQEIQSGIQADLLLGLRPDMGPSPIRLSRKQRYDILFEIGKTVARLHSCGLAHRDLYLCHFFPVLKKGAGLGNTGVDVYLIDLARLFAPRSRFHRWRLKDLSALVYSARRYGLGGVELSTIWQGYFTASGLPGWSWPLWRMAADLKAGYIWLTDKERKATSNRAGKGTTN